MKKRFLREDREVVNAHVFVKYPTFSIFLNSWTKTESFFWKLLQTKENMVFQQILSKYREALVGAYVIKGQNPYLETNGQIQLDIYYCK